MRDESGKSKKTHTKDEVEVEENAKKASGYTKIVEEDIESNKR